MQTVVCCLRRKRVRYMITIVYHCSFTRSRMFTVIQGSENFMRLDGWEAVTRTGSLFELDPAAGICQTLSTHARRRDGPSALHFRCTRGICKRDTWVLQGTMLGGLQGCGNLQPYLTHDGRRQTLIRTQDSLRWSPSMPVRMAGIPWMTPHLSFRCASSSAGPDQHSVATYRVVACFTSRQPW